MANRVIDFPKGTKVNFLAGPTRIPVNGAEVIGDDNGFLVTKDETGRERKVRPGALTAA